MKILRNRRGVICHEKIAGEGMDMANEKKELTELRAEIIKRDDAIVELLDARRNYPQK